jgi:hypothetical protein
VILSLVIACSEQGLTPVKDDPPFADELVACEDGPWEDRTVQLADCTAPTVEWDLVERWRYYEPSLRSVTVHSGRFADSDGDGDITRADAMSLWGAPFSLYDEGVGHILVDADGALVRLDRSYAGTWHTFARTRNLSTI